MRERLVGACALVALAGCGHDLGRSGSLGQLGEGYFTYGCVDEGDAVCNITDAVNTAQVDIELGLDGQIPAAVAVGSRFDLSYWGDVSTDDGELLFVEVIPASPTHIRQGGGFVIDDAGTFAFLAHSPKGVVADFTHVTAVEPSRLDLWVDEQKMASLQMDEGRHSHIAVVPNDDTNVALAGALPYIWTSSNEDVLRIDEVETVGTPSAGVEHNDDEVRIVAMAAGNATLTVSAGNLTKAIEITITPEVAP